METKIIQKNVLVPTTRDATIYVAKDGKEFERESECINYEKILLHIEYGKTIFKTPDLSYYSLEAILQTAFDGYGSNSEIQLFLFTATKDEDKINASLKFLSANGIIEIFKEDFMALEAGKLYAVVSWEHDADTDYPSYHVKIKSVEEINKAFELITNDIKQKLKI